jgi:hypothetical protein
VFLGAATAACLAWWGRVCGPAARPVALRLIAAVAAGGVLFLPWLPSFLEQAAHTGTPWAPAPRPTVVADLTLRDLGGGAIAEAGLVAALVVLLVAIGVFGRPSPSGIVLGLQAVPGVRGEAAVAALTLAAGAVAGLATSSTYASRYSSVVLPLIVLVVARGFTVVPGRRVPWAVAGLFVLLAVPSLVENVRGPRTQARELAEHVAAGAGAGDALVTCPDQLGPAIRRALDQEGLEAMPVLAYPTLGDGRRVDWYDYEARNDAADPADLAAAVVERVPADAQIWVAWNGAYRTFDGDCEALLNGIAERRGYFEIVEVDGIGEFFEHAGLVVFR